MRKNIGGKACDYGAQHFPFKIIVKMLLSVGSTTLIFNIEPLN